jgi:DNA adenine methylase
MSKKPIRFLRYPGGKNRMLFFLSPLLPDCNTINGRYIEPFIGGGSIFLHIRPQEALLSDLNKELIDLYRGIRNYPHRVWEIFANFPQGREAYYRIRNDTLKDKPLYYRAARTLYLNRTCFKGMWRHNACGQFNVGYGGEQRRWVVTHKNLTELSLILRKATLVHSDFELILKCCNDGDFVFLDPPYKPGERELSEAHYNNGKFSFTDQIRLAETLKEISKKKKIRWLMTNSSNSEICRLYHGFRIVKLPIGTSSKIGVTTDNSREVIISNYL